LVPLVALLDFMNNPSQIHIISTPYGDCHLPEEIGGWAAKMNRLALCGDRRRRETKDAIETMNDFEGAIETIMRVRYTRTGKISPLDL